MKNLFTCLLVLVASSLLACTEPYDDTAIRSDIEDLKERVTKLEELCTQMNNNISSLQAIVAALQNQDYITGVTTITENGKTIGYTIAFAKGTPITIYHGQDGKDSSYVPLIGVKQDTDNIYYWTLDGEWLTDASGNKIKANGIDGTNGNDGATGPQGPEGEQGPQGPQGITPQLKIENGKWYISYDNGSTWNEVGQATGDAGKDGDAFFQSVTQDE